MVQFNFGERTIKAKVVYYGPAQSGKTTNLEQIHRLTDPAGNNRLISLNTAQDRTLFFDLLPFSLGAVSGYDFKVQLYTVPGQVQYNATRRVVLAGADAVVFVADSRRAMFKENLSAFENMKVNLLANRLVPEKVPLVIQYNKQDLPDLLTEAELSRALNPWGRKAFPAVGTQGRGVLETFVAVVQDMLAAIAVKYNLKEKGLDPSAVPDVVAEAFASVLKQAAASAPPVAAVPPLPPRAPAPAAAAPSPAILSAPRAAAVSPAGPPPAQPSHARVVVSQPATSSGPAPLQASPEAGLVSEELLHRSIKSNVELAEALAGLVREMNLGLGAILSHAELLSTYGDRPEKRTSALASIRQEAARLRRFLQDFGVASLPAAAAPAGAAQRPAPAPAPKPAMPRGIGPVAASAPAAGAAPRPAPPSAPRPAPAPAMASVAPIAGNAGFDALLRDAVGGVRRALDARSLSVQIQVPPGTALPRCPPQNLRGALAGLLEGAAAVAPPLSALSLRCERKPVLLRTREGEVKRDFLMVALSPGAALTPEEQQKVVQGGGAGPVGLAARSIREMGGFVRFAPLPGGGLETRIFLPAA